MYANPIICFRYCIHFYLENVALHKSAWQKHPFHNDEFNALLAVDGRIKDISIRGGECVTSGNYETAEWRVDLKNVLSIHHIVIQYSQSKPFWGKYCSSIFSIDICLIIFHIMVFQVGSF